MTLIVAWRDPFCMVSDDLETSGISQDASSVGPKMEALSERLALGFAGPKDGYRKVVKRVRKLPVVDWNTFEEATREIADKLNEKAPCRLQSTVVVAGWIGEVRGIFDSVGPMGEAPTRRYAFAGSGGILANAARALATRFWPDEEVIGEELLRTIVEAGVRADPWSRKPIHRIDLDRLRTPYQWRI